MNSQTGRTGGAKGAGRKQGWRDEWSWLGLTDDARDGWRRLRFVYGSPLGLRHRGRQRNGGWHIRGGL